MLDAVSVQLYLVGALGAGVVAGVVMAFVGTVTGILRRR